MSVKIENITIAQLREWMAIKLEVDEAEYQEWRILEKEKQAAKEIRGRRKSYVSGSDFKKYWICVRRLYWDTHDPLIKKGIINKGYFTAIKKHDIIEEKLRAYGWSTEGQLKKRLVEYSIDGIGHYDGLSPSETFLLSIKHNPPSLADELQEGWYQYLHEKLPTIIILYRERVSIIPDHSRLMGKYIPRVVGTIIHDHLPPLHPRFPRCRGYCDYAPRCERTKRFKMREPISQEWTAWLEKIGAGRKKY